jgi:hypothetical protein
VLHRSWIGRTTPQIGGLAAQERAQELAVSQSDDTTVIVDQVAGHAEPITDAVADWQPGAG